MSHPYESLDESRSLLHAARFVSPSELDIGEVPDECSDPPAAELEPHIHGDAPKDVDGFQNADVCADRFTRDALSTLKHIQALVNNELGRQVRIQQHQVMRHIFCCIFSRIFGFQCTWLSRNEVQVHLQPTAPLDGLSLRTTHRVSPVLLSALTETVELLSQKVNSRREQPVSQQPSPSPVSWGSSEAWSLEEEDGRDLKTTQRLRNPCRGDYGRRLAYDNMLKKRRECGACLHLTGPRQQPLPDLLESGQSNGSFCAPINAWEAARPTTTSAFRCFCACTEHLSRMKAPQVFNLVLERD